MEVRRGKGEEGIERKGERRLKNTETYFYYVSCSAHL